MSKEISPCRVHEYMSVMCSRGTKGCMQNHDKQEAEYFHIENEQLREALFGLLGPGLLGSQSDDQIRLDYGELGLSQITRARKSLRRESGDE